ncbi:GNAT family N-acetyltransferase [Vibrio nigripulchritudo]|uniref:GNAT family N-acetyltransferase n=1 Tax=Vibrio nigripulchritudo TaxID=28173 RepID=UPI002493AE9A|nr:GNAT family N-acetyltransferase [Vibrio nigripulchritudo]BDU37849.1 hypothetical protein TUMSATVNIG2_23180 [Vibrio nigripulchritudo]BDU43569.1 hypothetical protein TUMSATVNIG3_23670 [Vibrio nigripulchritudo]
MEIFTATKDDLEVLADFNKQLIRDEGHRYLKNKRELLLRMERWLTHEYSAALFKLDNEIFDYALWREHTDFVYIRQFFICDKFRKRGFGGRAFRAVKGEYWKSKRLRLEVLAHNKRALGFWKSVGFNEYSVTLEQDK